MTDNGLAVQSVNKVSHTGRSLLNQMDILKDPIPGSDQMAPPAGAPVIPEFNGSQPRITEELFPGVYVIES